MGDDVTEIFVLGT